MLAIIPFEQSFSKFHEEEDAFDCGQRACSMAVIFKGLLSA